MPKPSLRGLTFQFEPEEHVLCFEPDPTKARVLYEAKILENVPSRDHRGNRRPEYLIHFQGWNSSWDRTVPEAFVLKNSERNQHLKRRLASITRHSASNKTRKRRIEDLLDKHFKGHLPKFTWSDSESSSASGSSSEEEDEGEETDSVSSSQDEHLDSDLEEDDERMDSEESDASETKDSCMNGHARLMDQDSDEEVQLLQVNGAQELDEEMGQPSMLELDLPKNLRLKLEDDCYYICCKEKLVRLPADPNVLSILEGYVKNFAANILCATEEKARPYSIRDKSKGQTPEKNIELCKQVIDGIRLTFDFGLPLILLYDEEKAQFESLNDSEMGPAVQSPLRSTHPSQVPVPSSPRSPCSSRFSPRHFKDEPVSEPEEEEETPSRRMTRQAFLEETQKHKDTPKIKAEAVATSPSRTRHSESRRHKDSGCSEEDQPEDSDRRSSLRSRSRHGSGAGAPSTATESHRQSQSSEKTEPMADGGSSVHSSSAHTLNSQDTDETISFRYREAALANIFTWKLVPEDVANQRPAQPSAIYGAQHLLRLFVKMPEVVGQMHLMPTKLEAVKVHLDLFIEYLSSRCSEMFLDSHYEDTH